MAEERQARVFAIFEEAVDQPIATRDAWLQVRCAGDADLLADVQKLLAVDANADGAIRTGQYAADLNAARPEHIGPYRIVDTIGAGGMGIVYKAERDDGAFERTVAIKLMSAGAATLSEEARIRFTNERQILARMSHPNIAQLLDGGTADGQAYLVMEYVDGKPLEHSADRSVTATLSLFLKVCDAVNYAHDNLVLHRDIKPANVLLDASGETKLLDFGVAKINQAIASNIVSDLTGAEAAPMTLSYSSPERIMGDTATISADVYSLGVYLFELLTGSRPYDLSGLTLGEAHRKVAAADIGSNFDGPPDLRVIIATATHSDPARRYASAAALARDIRAFMERKPIAARGDDWRYLAGRFVSRYRYAVAASVAGLGLLVAALAVTGWAYLEAERQTAIAESERDIAEDAVQFLSSVLGHTNPWVSGEKEMTVADILVRARGEVNGIEDQMARAYVETALSRAHHGRGEYDDALAFAEAAVGKLEQGRAEGSRRAEAYGAYGQALHDNDQNEAALAALDKALDALASDAKPDETIAVAVYTLLGAVHEALADETAAEAAYAQGITAYERSQLNDGPLLAQIVNNLGRLKHKQGDHTEATRRYTQAVDLVQDQPVQHAIALSNLAGVHFEQNRYAEAEAAFLEALDLFETSVGATHPDALIAQTTLASAYARWGKFDLAEATIDAALAGTNETLGEGHFITAYVQNVAASAYCGGSNPALGLVHAERSLATRRELLPEGHWSIASGRSVLGFCAIQTGELSRARAELEAAYAALAALRGENDVQTQLAVERMALLAAAEAAQ